METRQMFAIWRFVNAKYRVFVRGELFGNGSLQSSLLVNVVLYRCRGDVTWCTLLCATFCYISVAAAPDCALHCFVITSASIFFLFFPVKGYDRPLTVPDKLLQSISFYVERRLQLCQHLKRYKLHLRESAVAFIGAIEAYFIQTPPRRINLHYSTNMHYANQVQVIWQAR